MGKKKLVDLSVVFWFLLIPSCSVSSAQRCFYLSEIFKPNGTYDVNRRLVLSSLSLNIIANNGFYTTSIGQDQNIAYGLGMCTPGADPLVCSNCIALASNGLSNICPNQTEGLAWAENRVLCMVRYSNRAFFGSLEMEPFHRLCSNEDIKVNLTKFDYTWEALMGRVIAEATMSPNPVYYGAGTEKIGAFQNIYGFVQCSKDISPQNCTECLRKSVDSYRSCCRGKQGGITERPSCFMRWDISPFFGIFEDKKILPIPPPKKDGGSISSETIMGVTGILTFLISMLLALGFAICLCRKRKAHQEFATEMRSRTIYGTAPPDDGSLQFDFKAIEAATSSFQKNNKLGHVGFGALYKA